MTRLLTLFTLLPYLLFAEEAAPPAVEPMDFGSQLLRMVTILLLMVGALIALSWVLKRMMAQRIEQMNASSQIQILERRPIGPKSSLFLIEVEGKRMVIGESSAGIHPVATLGEEEEERYETLG